MTIDDEMGEIVREFLIESFENLDKLDQDLLNWKQTLATQICSVVYSALCTP